MLLKSGANFKTKKGDLARESAVDVLLIDKAINKKDIVYRLTRGSLRQGQQGHKQGNNLVRLLLWWRRKSKKAIMDAVSEAPSTSTTTDRGTKRRRKKDQDITRINIGGRVFTTAKLMLTLSPTYFSSKFKDEWDDNDDDDNGSGELLFVDQNPDTFAILLDFMREGLI